MRKFSYGLWATAMAVATAASTAQSAVIFTEDFNDASATDDAQWAANTGAESYTAAPTPKGLSFSVADGATVRIGRLFSTNASATSFKLTYEVYLNSNNATQRHYGQLSSGTVASPGTGTGGFARVAANNNANFQFLYSNGATQTVTSPTVLSTGWHTIELTVVPGAAGSGSYSYKIDGNAVQNVPSSGAVLVPTNVQLGQNVSNGTAGAPDTSAWYDSIKVEQFAPTAGVAANNGPASGATNVGTVNGSVVDVSLNWLTGGNTSNYDVFFWKDGDAPALVSDNTAGLSYAANGLLGNQLYHWRVDSNNAVGDTTSGTVFDFTTTAVPEPASLAAIALGAGALVRRRRA